MNPFTPTRHNQLILRRANLPLFDGSLSTFETQLFQNLSADVGPAIVSQDTETWRQPDVVTSVGRSEAECRTAFAWTSDLCVGSYPVFD
jgi:hypothetical protein